MFARPDGDLVRDVHPVRRIMPFLMPTRTESFVLCREKIRAAAAKEFLEAHNRQRPSERPATLFHLLLRSLALSLAGRPRMNRFLAGGRLYQRRGIWISFSGKRRMEEGAPIFTCKREFLSGESLDEMIDAIYDKLTIGRSGKETTTDKEIHVLLRLPPLLLRLVMRGAKMLNQLNLLPASMIANDPMFASIFVANLGSVGIGACYHHNYEYGTIPIFITIGRLHDAAVINSDRELEVAEVFEIKYTYDERIEDGFYCAAALDRVKYLLEHPAEL